MRVRDDGGFRSANQAGLVAFSMAQWRHLDPDAAKQFCASPTADRSEALQREFIAVSGLGLRDRLAASIGDARRRYGGHDVAQARPSRI